MKRLNKIILAGALLLAGLTGLAGKANALVSVSTASTSGTTLVPAPSSSSKSTKLKACILGNATGSAVCMTLQDGSTTKLVLCAAANSTAVYPNSVPSPAFMSGTSGALTQLFGEDLAFLNAINVVGSTTSASVTLTCSSITN